MSLAQKVAKWVIENDAKGITTELGCNRLAKLYMEMHPNTISFHSARRYGVMARSGKIKLTNDQFEEAKKMLNGEMEQESTADFSDPLGMLIDFPGSWAEINDPITIQGIKKLGICSDIHLPYHDKFAVQACFAEFKKRGVDGIYLNGDIMDLEDVSRFEKMPDGRYLRDEIEVGRAFVKSLRKLFPEIPIYWKDGNHEKRLESYVSSKAPELVKLFGMDIPTQLELADYNIIHVPEHKVAKFGKLWIAHGHELGLKSGTVNIARQVRMRVGVNVIFGHWHKNQHDTSRNLADEVHGAWALGCLAYLKPRYTGVLNQWTQGAATVDLNDDGSFQVNAFQIVDGVVV
jgi:predicted phosphodiesterase